MRARSHGWLFLALALFSGGKKADAEPTAADKSLATQLFKEGRTLVDQGKIGEGCRKLEESQRLDPGGGTLLNLALCHEKEGRSATAWAEFTEALGIAKKDARPQRVELAEQHIAALEPTLSRLVIEVPMSSDLPDLEVKRDGSPIRRAAWGTSMPIDPGDHVVEVQAPGKIVWSQSVSIAARSDVKTITVPALENAPAAAVAEPSTPTTTHSGAEGEALARPARTGSISPAAWVALGIGAAGAAFGTYFGLHAISEQKTANQGCPNDICNKDAVDANSQAIKAANLSTVGFSVGVVGIGLGVYLLVTGRSAPSHASLRAPELTASFGSGRSELSLRGRW